MDVERLPEPSARRGRGTADWYLRGQVGTVRRLGPRGPVQLTGSTESGDPFRTIIPLSEAAALGAAITAAAQPKETP